MKVCLDTALKLLGRRDHSCHELGLKLAQRGFAPPQIAAAIAECRRLHYLDDEAFSNRYTIELRRKGYGVRRIELSLKAKGVAPELIQHSIEHYGTDHMQLEDCRRVMCKKLRTIGKRSAGEIKTKLYRFLANRGFSPEIIQQAFAEATWEDL